MTKQERALYMKEWRAKQPPSWWAKNRAYMSRWRASRTPEEIAAHNKYKSLYYLDNKQRFVALTKLRIQGIRSDPLLLEEFLEKRRLAKRAKIRGITEDQWIQLVIDSDFRCTYCGQEFTADRLPEPDHVVPVKLGGPRSVDNIVPSCRSCNARKQRKPLAQFLAELHEDLEK